MPARRSAPLAAALLVLTTSVGAAAGPDRAAAEALARCAEAYGACSTLCGVRHRDSQAAEAGCLARCAAERAACEAKAGYDQAKPWLEDQLRLLDDFLKGFRDPPPNGGTPAPPRPSRPPAATPDEADT